MALPIHKDKGGRWRAYVTQKDEDEYLMEQDHPWDRMQQSARWKMTDEKDVPTNLAAWQVYQNTIRGSYSKPLRTAERSRAEAYALEETACSRSYTRRPKSTDGQRFTILDRDAKFQPEYVRRDKCRSVNERLRREHFSVDLDADLDEQMERARAWAAPGKKSSYRPLAACGTVTRLNDPLDWSDNEGSPEPEPVVYSRKYRRPVDEDDESTLATYEEWKKAVKDSWPKRNTATISCFEEKVLGKMAHQPGSAISSQLFVNESTGTTGFLSAVMRTPAYWAKRFEGLESTHTSKYDAVPSYRERMARAPSPMSDVMQSDED